MYRPAGGGAAALGGAVARSGAYGAAPAFHAIPDGGRFAGPSGTGSPAEAGGKLRAPGGAGVAPSVMYAAGHYSAEPPRYGGFAPPGAASEQGHSRRPTAVDAPAAPGAPVYSAPPGARPFSAAVAREASNPMAHAAAAAGGAGAAGAAPGLRERRQSAVFVSPFPQAQAASEPYAADGAAATTAAAAVSARAAVQGRDGSPAVTPESAAPAPVYRQRRPSISEQARAAAAGIITNPVTAAPKLQAPPPPTHQQYQQAQPQRQLQLGPLAAEPPPRRRSVPGPAGVGTPLEHADDALSAGPGGLGTPAAAGTRRTDGRTPGPVAGTAGAAAAAVEAANPPALRRDAAAPEAAAAFMQPAAALQSLARESRRSRGSRHSEGGKEGDASPTAAARRSARLRGYEQPAPVKVELRSVASPLLHERVAPPPARVAPPRPDQRGPGEDGGEAVTTGSPEYGAAAAAALAAAQRSRSATPEAGHKRASAPVPVHPPSGPSSGDNTPLRGGVAVEGHSPRGLLAALRRKALVPAAPEPAQGAAAAAEHDAASVVTHNPAGVLAAQRRASVLLSHEAVASTAALAQKTAAAALPPAGVATTAPVAASERPRDRYKSSILRDPNFKLAVQLEASAGTAEQSHGALAGALVGAESAEVRGASRRRSRGEGWEGKGDDAPHPGAAAAPARWPPASAGGALGAAPPQKRAVAHVLAVANGGKPAAAAAAGGGPPGGAAKASIIDLVHAHAEVVEGGCGDSLVSTTGGGSDATAGLAAADAEAGHCGGGDCGRARGAGGRDATLSLLATADKLLPHGLSLADYAAGRVPPAAARSARGHKVSGGGAALAVAAGVACGGGDAGSSSGVVDAPLGDADSGLGGDGGAKRGRAGARAALGMTVGPHTLRRRAASASKLARGLPSDGPAAGAVPFVAAPAAPAAFPGEARSSDSAARVPVHVALEATPTNTCGPRGDFDPVEFASPAGPVSPEGRQGSEASPVRGRLATAATVQAAAAPTSGKAGAQPRPASPRSGAESGKVASARAGRFVDHSGRTLRLGVPTSAADPLPFRVEALRAYLAALLGEDNFVRLYRAISRRRGLVPATKFAALIKLMLAETIPEAKPQSAAVVPLVYQLFHCEDAAFSSPSREPEKVAASLEAVAGARPTGIGARA